MSIYTCIHQHMYYIYNVTRMTNLVVIISITMFVMTTTTIMAS